ncbi:MAG: glycosyltransferase family 9 protein [Bdellovibrionales bacterium]
MIRLGALGDLVLCFQAFHEIRVAFPSARIALLTMPAFAAFARSMPWFDEVLTDSRATLSRLREWVSLARQVYAFRPQRVFDLQGKFRQSLLFGLMGGWMGCGPQWSGAARFCSHPRPWPPKPGTHFCDFLSAQLRAAEVPAAGGADLSWLDAPMDCFQALLPQRPFALLIPGCSVGREFKRWPPKRYAALANRLLAKGIESIAVGTAAEAESIAELCRNAPHVCDFSGRTSLHQLAALARRSVCVVGNNTGPTHLAAAVGAPTLMLMSEKCTPLWSAPRGPLAKVLQGYPLASLTEDEVWRSLGDFESGRIAWRK